MAQSYVFYPAQTGGTTDYSIPFEYLSPEYVKATVDGVAAPFTFLSTYMLQFDTAPVGDLKIYRETSTEPLNVYTDGSVLIDDELNGSLLQALHIAEETRDAALLQGLNGQFNAGGRRIENVGSPVEDTDAVTKGWAETSGSSFVAQAGASASQAGEHLQSIQEFYLGGYPDDQAATTAAGTPIIGQLYTNTTVNEARRWNGAAWVKFSQATGTITRGEGVGDGSTAVFNLPNTAEPTNTHVFIDGRRITQGYTLSGGTLTLSEPLGDGVDINWDVYEALPVGTTADSLVTVSDPGGYFAGQTVSSVLQELGASIEQAENTIAQHELAINVIQAPVTPENYSGTPTQKVQAALNSGSPEVLIDDTYVCDALTVPSTVKLLYGRGELRTSSDGVTLLTASGLNGTVFAVDLRGSAVLNTTSVSGNDGIRLTGNSQSVTVQDCTIQLFRFRPIIDERSTDLRIRNCKFINNNVGPRLMGTQRGWITGNLVDGTCLVSTQFCTGIALSSTAGNSFGVPRDIFITENITRNLVNAQGILVHAGINVHVTGNNILGAIIGIGVNPFNMDDFINYPLIAGNTIDGHSGSWGFGGANSGIVVQSGGSTVPIAAARILDNFVNNGNRSLGGNNQGGIQLGHTDHAQVSGNTIVASGSNGVVCYDCRAALIQGNQIDTVFSAAGEQNGIYEPLDNGKSSTGLVDGNVISDVGTGVSVTTMVEGTNQVY